MAQQGATLQNYNVSSSKAPTPPLFCCTLLFWFSCTRAFSFVYAERACQMYRRLTREARRSEQANITRGRRDSGDSEESEDSSYRLSLCYLLL
jgi:hypothetical protein